jgi:hypothetical protein
LRYERTLPLETLCPLGPKANITAHSRFMAICAPRDTAGGLQDTTPPYPLRREIPQLVSLSCLKSRRSFGGTQNPQKLKALLHLVGETSAGGA